MRNFTFSVNSNHFTYAERNAQDLHILNSEKPTFIFYAINYCYGVETIRETEKETELLQGPRSIKELLKLHVTILKLFTFISIFWSHMDLAFPTSVSSG